MHEQKTLCRLPRVQVSRQLVPAPIECSEAQEELGCEELEERIVPGGLLSTVCNVVKKTAGWGC